MSGIDPMTRSGRSLDQALAAQRKARERLAEIREVNGIGITRIGSGFGLKVNLVARPGPDVRIPEEIDEVPVRVQVVGPIRARTGG